MEGEARVLGSIARIAQKEAEDCDLAIADYLVATWYKQPTLYGMNHPTQPVAFEMFKLFVKSWAGITMRRIGMIRLFGAGASCPRHSAGLRSMTRKSWG
tara:strand:+ start:202 stop:498 length:297 start_codon:yes stop_codon:yes gene_type:complete